MQPISEAWMDGLDAALKAERVWVVDATTQWLAENRKEAIRTINTRNPTMTMQPISDAMSFDDLVPVESKYLTKNDVGEDGVILTIRGFKRETLKSDEGDEEKTVMYFEEADYKPMILNRTNAQLLPIITGAANAGQARGRQIVVYNDPTVGFGGRITGGVRLKKIPGPPKAASHPDAF